MMNVSLFLVVCSALLIGCTTMQAPAERAQYHVSIGKRYVNIGHHAGAKSEFLTAARLDPTNPNLWGMAGSAAKQNGDFHEAIQYFMKVAELNPNDSRAYADIGSVHKQSRNFSEAITFFEKTLKLNPQEIGAAAMLAEIYFELQDFKKCEYYMNEFDMILARTRADLLPEKRKEAVEESLRKFANYRATIKK